MDNDWMKGLNFDAEEEEFTYEEQEAMADRFVMHGDDFEMTEEKNDE